MMQRLKLIVLDRDGIINYDSPHYIKNPDEWLPIPGSLDAIKLLKDAGYTLVVATNQSGVARGLYSEEMLHAIHDKMEALLSELGCELDRIYYCPHHPKEGCACRKPQPGMLLQALEDFECSPEEALMIGDRDTDEQVAAKAGMSFIRVHHTREVIPGEQYDSLMSVVKHLLEIEKA